MGASIYVYCASGVPGLARCELEEPTLATGFNAHGLSPVRLVTLDLYQPAKSPGLPTAGHLP